MNYEKIYAELIDKRRKFPISRKNGYCERHHIVPRFLNGNDDEDNLVNLFAREHYVAHLLLIKVMERRYGKQSYAYEKAVRAVTYFQTYCSNAKMANRKAINFNSRIYETVRKEFAKVISEHIKKTGMYKGEGNPMFGKHRTEEEKRKISATRIKRGCGIGSKNPMYGKSCTYKMTEEEREEHYRKVARSMTGKKAMYHGETKKRTWVNEEDVEKYIAMGYVVGFIKSDKRRSTKGMRRMKHHADSKYILVRPDEVNDYLQRGFVFVKRGNK